MEENILKKNDIYIIDVVDNGMDLEGICKVDGIPVFVPGAIKGEKIKVKILKVNKSLAFGKIEEILEKSEDRVTPLCDGYKRCGGCQGLHIDYDRTLEMKKANCINTLKKQNIDYDFTSSEIYGMGNPYNYRNKVQYPIRQNNGEISLGMFAKRSHDLVNVTNCCIQDAKINEIAVYSYELLKEFAFIGYDEEQDAGDIKNILVRRGKHTDNVMVVFVVNGNNVAKDKRWNGIVEKLTAKYKNILSVMLNINDEKTNVILSGKNICIYGQEYITDYIGDYVFKIGVNSFFQVNTVQAEVLYNLLKEKLNLNGNENLLDLYSGVGSIGIFLSDKTQKVYGIEIVEEAVKMAKDNISLNRLENVEYIVGDATEEIAKLEKQGTKFDVVVVDPPRKGLDIEGIETLIKIGAKKIGYVSCNVATLARDLKALQDVYDIQSIDFVDMFPFTRTC